MGTEVQSKMYFPGYLSIQNLSSNVAHGSWSLLHENRNLKNGQQCDLFSTRPVLDRFQGSNKEQLRQTILKHESMFRHQLNELHRLYGKQKDLMNEIKSKELLKHQNAAGSSLSTLSSSGFPAEYDRKNRHMPNLPFIDSSNGRQSPSNSIGNPLQAGGGPGPSRFGMKNYESSDSRGKTLQRRFFDLELPGDEYLSDGEEPEEPLMQSGTENYPPNRNKEVAQARDRLLFNHIGETSGCNNSTLSSGLHSGRSNGLTDLNEPVQIGESSASTSFVKLGSVPRSKEEIERPVSSANAYKGVWPSAKKFPVDPQIGKDERVTDLHLKNERKRKEWSANAPVAEQTICYSGGRVAYQSSEMEARIACEPAKVFASDETEAEKRKKMTIFGVQISERALSSSAKALHSDVTISVQGNTTFDTSTQSKKASSMLLQSPEVIDCNSIPSTPSRRAEVSHQNGICFHAKLHANELQACQPSTSPGFPNGDSNCSSGSEKISRHGNQRDHSRFGHRLDTKSAIDVNDVGLLNKHLDGVTGEQNGEQNIFSLHGLRKQDSSQGRLPWLEEVPVCNGKPSRESEDYHQSNRVPDALSHWHMYREGLKSDGLVLEKGFSNDSPDSRHRIDLNICFAEEETEMTAASEILPVMKTKTVIDLEAPVIDETNIVEEDSVESKCKGPPELPHEDLLGVAAEALVAISSSQAHNMQDNAAHHFQESSATCYEIGTLENVSLLWLAEIVTAQRGDLDNENVAKDKGTACDEELLRDGMDYFEQMTLNLVETKEEQHCYVRPNSDPPIEEVTLPKRPRRGQAKRGRQRKDFQRDVLPGIASLSRNDVTEDLQLIEGLIRESGGSWQSSLTQRNASKSGRGRGRKRMITSAPSRTVTEVIQPQIEQPKCDDLQGHEERRSITGWGKRTRRPPRQRYGSPVP